MKCIFGKSCEEKEKVEAYFCPQCKSVNVGYVFGLGNLFGVMPKMECRGCGFSSVSFPIVVANKKKFVKKKFVKKVVKKIIRRKKK